MTFSIIWRSQYISIIFWRGWKHASYWFPSIFKSCFVLYLGVISLNVLEVSRKFHMFVWRCFIRYKNFYMQPETKRALWSKFFYVKGIFLAKSALFKLIFLAIRNKIRYLKQNPRSQAKYLCDLKRNLLSEATFSIWG